MNIDWSSFFLGIAAFLALCLVLTILLARMFGMLGRDE